MRNGRVVYLNIAIVVARSLISLVGMSLLFYIQTLAQSAKINGAVILSIMSGRSVLTAIVFYFLYNERLKMRHIIGIFLLLGCVTFISFGVEKPDTSEEDRAGNVNYNSVMAWIVALSLINCLIYTVSGVLARVSHNRGFSQL